MQNGPVAIQALAAPAGAQASISLPIEAMRDIRTKKHSWNVIQKQYSKYNENNTVEDTPEGTCMCVKYPAGPHSTSQMSLAHIALSIKDGPRSAAA